MRRWDGGPLVTDSHDVCSCVGNTIGPRLEQASSRFLHFQFKQMEFIRKGCPERRFRTKLLQTSLRRRSSPREVNLFTRQTFTFPTAHIS